MAEKREDFVAHKSNMKLNFGVHTELFIGIQTHPLTHSFAYCLWLISRYKARVERLKQRQKGTQA